MPARPSDATSPTSARIRHLIARATTGGGPWSPRVPVTSTKASSIETGSTSGENSPRTAMISADTRPYLARSTGRKVACGQSRAAVRIGIAECTPNGRAS